jgi:hypothetical protein
MAQDPRGDWNRLIRRVGSVQTGVEVEQRLRELARERLKGREQARRKKRKDPTR